MATQKDGTEAKPEDQTETAVHDHATHPLAGSGLREDKSFSKTKKGKDAEPDDREQHR